MITATGTLGLAACGDNTTAMNDGTVRSMGRRLSVVSPIIMMVLGAVLLAGRYDVFVQRLDIGT